MQAMPSSKRWSKVGGRGDDRSSSSRQLAKPMRATFSSSPSTRRSSLASASMSVIRCSHSTLVCSERTTSPLGDTSFATQKTRCSYDRNQLRRSAFRCRYFSQANPYIYRSKPGCRSVLESSSKFTLNHSLPPKQRLSRWPHRGENSCIELNCVDNHHNTDNNACRNVFR